ncbi:isopentenyl-diphosphate Delta-isomerase [Thermaurantimonas aggregans]|uniref:Isopentenyl-diphosphate delta-isomerase n=1 Tax=Thermaurantimonas aggregans TaxID=2173829 RepID=A0A401XNI7_9FLAO|nr:isopentenyl-diphosphate Delta-isomerase [Thermaurantimonas aggregans]
MIEHVILVDAHDRELGLMEKMEAHQKGLLHRAFSVFVLNDKKELLLQRRAFDKYHSGGLWTNTCCSHPRKDEDVEAAAHRRLKEEMGFDCELEKVLDFVYRADFSDGLTEHEFDHVFVGYYNGSPQINTQEVAEYKWMPLDEVKRDLQENPDNYTEWFKIIFDRFYSHVKN